MAYLFPIGTIAASTNSGTIDSVSYSLFEPNMKANSTMVHSVLTTKYEQQTLLARKKAEPYLQITYEYENIYTKEFRQIEHFIDAMGGGLTSFYCIDFSKGQTPTSVTITGSNWLVAINDTHLYSTTANQKADRAVLWDGKGWKEGDITTITSNTSMIVDIDTNKYGALSLTNANAEAMVYPAYTVYVMKGSLSALKPTVFIDGSISTSGYGGFMYSGSIQFISKYKV